MKWNKNWEQKPWAPYTVATCSAVVLYMVLAHLPLFAGWLATLIGILEPVLVGVLLAYLIDPIARFFQQKPLGKIKNKKFSRNIAVIAAVLSIVIMVFLLILAIVPPLVKSTSTLAANIGGYLTTFEATLDQMAVGLGSLNIDFTSFSGVGDELVGKLSELAPSGMDSILNTSYNVGNGFVNVLIGFVLAIYFLLDKDRLVPGLRKMLRNILKEKKYEALSGFCTRCDRILLRYIACNLLDSLIVGVINAIAMLIIGIPYCSLISVIAGVTNLAPTFGPIVGALIGGFILVLVKPSYALYFLIITVIIQTVDGSLLKPKLFGESLGISPLWILVTIVVGGRMFGVAGIMLAIPFAAIIDFMLKDEEAKVEARARLKAEETDDSDEEPKE